MVAGVIDSLPLLIQYTFVICCMLHMCTTHVLHVLFISSFVQLFAPRYICYLCIQCIWLSWICRCTFIVSSLYLFFCKDIWYIDNILVNLYMHISYICIVYMYIYMFFASHRDFFDENISTHLFHRQVLHVPFSMIPKWFGSLGIGWQHHPTANVGPWGPFGD